MIPIISNTFHLFYTRRILSCTSTNIHTKKKHQYVHFFIILKSKLRYYILFQNKNIGTLCMLDNYSENTI